MEKTNRNKRVELAQRTLDVVKNGFYKSKNGNVDVANAIENCITKTFTISPNDWENIVNKVQQENIKKVEKTVIKILNCTTIEAICQQDKSLKLGVLNFASAKNPGGGFLSGASAQEESLARSSCLYDSQIKDETMYDFNRSQSNFLYSDYMIYSPEVVFWFNDNGEAFEEPIRVDIITSPAPNKGAMMQHNRKLEIEQLETVFKSRIEKVLTLALANGIESLVLGAWGCGVFRNKSEDVATYFREVIENKFNDCFKETIFAVYDTSDKKANFASFFNQFSR